MTSKKSRLPQKTIELIMNKLQNKYFALAKIHQNEVKEKWHEKCNLIKPQRIETIEKHLDTLQKQQDTLITERKELEAQWKNSITEIFGQRPEYKLSEDRWYGYYGSSDIRDDFLLRLHLQGNDIDVDALVAELEEMAKQ